MILLPVVVGMGFVGISRLLQKFPVQHSISHSGKAKLSSERRPRIRAQAAFLSGKMKSKANQNARGDSHMKQTGMLVGNFEFNP